MMIYPVKKKPYQKKYQLEDKMRWTCLEVPCKSFNFFLTVNDC